MSDHARTCGGQSSLYALSFAVQFSFLPHLEFTFLGVQDGQSTQGISEGRDPSISDSSFGLAELLGHPDLIYMGSEYPNSESQISLVSTVP